MGYNLVITNRNISEAAVMSKSFLPPEPPERKPRYSPADYMFFFFSWCTWVCGFLVAAALLVDRDNKTLFEILGILTVIFFATWFIARIFRWLAMSTTRPFE